MTDSKVSGYATHDDYFATRFRQGLRTGTHAIELTPTEIAAYLPKPDPNHPTVGNRTVRRNHAASFGRYLREHEDWVSPAMLLRSPDIFKFRVKEEMLARSSGCSGSQTARSDIRILDGQHRMLGVHHRDRRRSPTRCSGPATCSPKAKKNGARARQVKEYEDRIKELNCSGIGSTGTDLDPDRDRGRRHRLQADVRRHRRQRPRDLLLGPHPLRHGRSSTAAVEPVAETCSVRERVDARAGPDRRNNPNLLGAKHVARSSARSRSGSTGGSAAASGQELREDALVESTSALLDTLLVGFQPLADVADGDLSPEDLRKRSLLGSTSMLRVLGGVYFELKQDGWDDDGIADFFTKLAAHMDGPVSADSPW